MSENLVKALLGNDTDRIFLYQTSPSFHATVDLLASLLPSWIDGLAAKANETDAVMRERLEALERSGIVGIQVADDPTNLEK